MARQEDSLVGRTIAGKFAIEAHIGSGAMGQVYRARHLALEKTVAVKVLHQDLARDETFAARFHREAKAASRLDHPNSMRVIDFGAEPDGMLYIAMEYLDGRDLLRVIADESPFPEARVVDILTQALAALVVAHDMGVIHRDLKPENIMVLDGTDDEGNRIDLVKVCDFGIAKISGRSTDSGGPGTVRGPLTTQGLVVGTPEYMSPEQGMGDPLDARSDLYSIGVILFQLLVGRLPFQAETALGIVFKQVNEPPPIPSTLRPGVDAHLEAVCLKALSKRREDRYQTAREMRSALRAFFGTDVTRGASVPMSMPATARLGRRPSLEHADTVGMPVSDGSAPTMRDGGDSDVDPIGTPGGTAALPALPVAHTNPWILGAIAVVVGAGVTALVAAQLGHPDARPSQATPGTLLDAAAASPLTSASPLASASASAWSTLVVPPRHLVAPTTSASVGARPSASPVSTPKPPASAPALSSPPAGSAVAGGFSLDTSAASPTVTRASGATAHDVRTAIPSWKLTQCYRDALQRGNKAIDGHLVLNLTIDGSGAVSRVGVKGPAPLVSGTGDCMIDAMGHVTVSNAAATGGTAEVDVACTPR